MNYHIKASSISNNDAEIYIKESNISFGTTQKTVKSLPNPAELLLGSLSACMLKNVERFSGMMKFSYAKAIIEIQATRLESPPKMDDIIYNLTIYSNDEKLNTTLLKKNLEKFGTIYNTLKVSCNISGVINIEKNI